MQNDLREIALTMLLDILEDGQFLHVEMSRALDKYDYLERKDKAFLRRLVSGTVERCVTLDAAINQVSKVPVKKMKKLVRAIMRMAAYQLLYMDAVADAVAVNEAVALMRKHHFAGLAGFVNGVLRSLIRQKDQLRYQEHEQLAMPKEIYDLLSRQYPNRAKEICEGYLQHEEKGTILRVNRSKMADEANVMKDVGAELVSEELGCYRIKGAGNLEYLPPFLRGEMVVQDTAACLPVYVSDIQPEAQVLDLCAAPGGKTIQAADVLRNGGLVISRDISPERCTLIDEAVERCGFTNCTVDVADATILQPDDEEKYDVVLVDAPCSGLGVIGSKPDIRFHFQEEGLQSLRQIQRQIIEAAVKAVRPGGFLVYSTCTLDRRENEEQLAYAKTLRASEIVNIENSLPACFTQVETAPGQVTVFPTERVCEGFYVGILKML